MPSDLAKKKAAKKKEAAKARQQKPSTKKADEVNGDGEKLEVQQNGATEVNGKIFSKSALVSLLKFKFSFQSPCSLLQELPV